METYPRVLVGTDGSADATAAVQIAARVAGRLGVPLRVVTIWEDGGERDQAWAREVLQGAEVVLNEAGAENFSIEDIEGEAPDALVELANDQPESLVVVGSAGLAKASSRLTGSTSNRLTHRSLADVLLARDPVPDRWNFVALATDGSDSSLHAVRRGLRLAAALNATPRLITANKSEEAGEKVLGDALAGLGADADGFEIEREVLMDSQAANAIVLAAWKYELVVVGNRGMSGPERLLGSVANKVSHGLKTNMLLVNTTRD